MESIAAAVVSLVASAASGSALRLIDPFKYKIKVENLDFKLRQLKAMLEDVQNVVDAETRDGKLIEAAVQFWLQEVRGIIEKLASECIENEERAKKKCFAGLFPDFKSRYQLSKKLDQEAAAVDELLNVSAFTRISNRPAALPPLRNYVAFQSRLPVFREIMDALMVPDENMVGVYGMGGVGKTTLVKQVVSQAIEEKLFDVVVMAIVGQTLDIRKIQGEIADSLGLKFEDESELMGRAARLHERLKREKNILVVLDDLWDGLDLEEVGIPSKDEHKGCKVLLTSRSLDVLSLRMGSQMNFAVSVLTDEEAWDLFRETVGGTIVNADVQPIAAEIAKECGGLPIAISTVARALKNSGLHTWKNALQQLRKPTDAESSLKSTLEQSYNHLESVELKSTFLLCSLMRDNASIGNLLTYGVGLSLFPEVVSLEEARDRIRTLVLKLKAFSLLIEGDIAEQFAMHDLVGDFALSIASRDHHVFTAKNEVDLQQLDRDTQKNLTQIWVHGSINELPDMLECPVLEVLQIFSDDPYLIPDHFFEGMWELKVLYLSNLSFTFLPSSLYLLKNLRSLCLHESALGEIAIIGELRNLEILSFVKSSIKYLPIEVRQLTNLKLLDLSDCSELEVIPSNVISTLTLLEELYMGNSFHHWDIEGGNNASLAELECLSHLTRVHLHIQDSHVMSNEVFFERLQRFKIFIGVVWDWDGAYEALTTLKLKLNRSSDILKHGVHVLLKKTEDLYLLELKGVKNIIHELDREGFPKLKCLHLHNSPDIQYVMNTLELVPSDAFRMLESLVLFNLPSLEKLFHGPLNAMPFGRLGIIEVEYCEKLKNLFSFNVARCLSQLVKIRIAHCPKMEEIVAEESGEFDSKNEAIDGIEFSQLCTLTLQNLPCLRNFCSKAKTSCLSQTQSKLLLTDGQSEEIISEDELNTMQLFNEKIAFPNLEELNLYSINTEKLWHPSSISFHCLTTLVVSKCHGLIKLMTSSTAKGLVQLTWMSVSACEMIEEIVATEDNEKEDEVIFHKLKCLGLSCLPSLESFHSGSCTFLFPSLEEMNMKECPKMKTFSQGIVCTPKLQKVTMKEFGDNIWWDGNLNSTVQKLFMESGEGAPFNIPSLPEHHALTHETLQEDKNGLHARSERETSENLHIPENTDSVRDFPHVVETEFKTKEDEVESESEITELASKYQNFRAPSSSDKEGISSTPMDSEAHSKSQQPLTCQDSHATSSDKGDPLWTENSQTPMNIESQVSLQVQKVPKVTDMRNNIPISLAAPAEQVSMLTSAFPTDTTFSQEPTAISASKIPSIPITEMPSHPTAKFEHLYASMEQLIKTCPEPSTHLVSSSDSDPEFRKYRSVSFDAYSYSMALIKRLLAKSPAELAKSADCFLFLSSLKNLRNCSLLNAQQLEAIQLYIENFDALVTSRPFYEQKIDCASAIKCSIEDERKGIVELKSSYEKLSSKIGMLSAEKEASKKSVCEIEEEVDHIRANMESLCNQLVIRKEKLETQMNALVEALRQQRITEDRANNIDDCWAKLRSLFA